MSTLAPVRSKIVYPESDGLPMADNTTQFRWIVTIQGGLDAVYRDEPGIFVAGNLLWYPVEGNKNICIAPDVFVVFGRPKGDRGSYLQWEEGNIAPQVVFEIFSPGNRAGKLTAKFKFYEDYGVEEYYLYDPDSGDLNGWLRANAELREIPQMNGWTSPRLKVKFELIDGQLRLTGPDGEPFATYVELVEQLEKDRQARDKERQEKEKERQRAERLATQLKSLGIEPEA
jgi:Uma2 family endonuclease